MTARNNTLPISSLVGIQQIRLPALNLAYYSGVGAGLGLTYRVYEKGVLRQVDQALVPIGRDGWVTLPVEYRPAVGKTYVLDVTGTDPHGHPMALKRTLVATPLTRAPREAIPATKSASAPGREERARTRRWTRE